MSSLRESASSSYYTQAAPPFSYSPSHVLHSPPQLVQSPPQLVQSPPQLVQSPPQLVQSPPQLVQSPPQLVQSPPQIVQSPPQVLQSPPQLVQSPPQIVQSPPQVLQSPPQLVQSPPQIVQSPPQVLQSPPQLVQSPPQIVQSPPQIFHSPPQLVQSPPQILQSPPQIVQYPPQVIQSSQRVVQSAPTFFPQPPPVPVSLSAPAVQFLGPSLLSAPAVHQRVVQTPLHTHVLQSPVIDVRATALPAIGQQVFAPVTGPAPCPTPVLSPAFTPLHQHSFFSPPQAQRTRTVLQQLQFVPDQTHVYTTTSYSPATRTTIYDADHLIAFSAPKPQIVKAPIKVLPRDSTALLTARDGPATVYTFPKMRILGAPIRIADRLSSRRQLRQRLRVERLKEKDKHQKEKKIFVFNRRNSD